MTTEFAGNLTKHPARSALAWYAGGVLLGTLALMAPQCHGPGASAEPVSWLDAAFTSTSAICVTGLGVRDTGRDFNLLGQFVILLLIQIGGIGIMTVTTYIMFGMDGRVDLRQKMIIAETLGGQRDADLRWVVRNVLVLTLTAEAIGAFVLAPWFYFYRNMDFGEALWHAIFHSISAFCNAGFSLKNNSLMDYVDDPIVNFTIIPLIVVGGIGFPVLLDLRRNWHGPWIERWDRLHLHTKLMLIGTTALILLGAVMFLALEWDYELKNRPLWQRPMIALFQSVTCRTAGFNTVEFDKLTNSSLFICILLMAIGGGACSTAGGFKVATIAVLLAHAWNLLRGRRRLNLFRKTVPIELVQRAIATAMLFFLVAVVALTLLLVIEQATHTQRGLKEEFLDSVFEIVSALGTVGLSTGLTGELSDPGQMLLMLLMFMGRLGPISMFIALSQTQRKPQLEFLKEEPLIG